MKFWDSSALVPIFVQQGSTREVRRIFDDDPSVLVWTLTDVEVHSAFQRLHREGGLDDLALRRVKGGFADLWEEVKAVALGETVRLTAMRCLSVHELSAADALQLAAALVATDGDPAGLELVTLDARLAGAARREGFHVVPVGT